MRGNLRVNQLGPARPEPLKGAALVEFHKPRVTGYVSGKDGSEAAAGRGHGWVEPSVGVVIEYGLTLAQLAHQGVRTDEPASLSEGPETTRGRRRPVTCCGASGPSWRPRQPAPSIGERVGAELEMEGDRNRTLSASLSHGARSPLVVHTPRPFFPGGRWIRTSSSAPDMQRLRGFAPYGADMAGNAPAPVLRPPAPSILEI